MEIWKDVVGYECLYLVSNLGNVRSVERKDRAGRNTLPGKVMQQTSNHKGYVRVSLTDLSGKTKKHSVHTLVLTAFVGECPKDHECCHENGIRDDNHLSNLRWGTREENWDDKRKHGTASVGENHPNASMTKEKVLEIKAEIATGARTKDIAEKFGISWSVVSSIKVGRTWRDV